MSHENAPHLQLLCQTPDTDEVGDQRQVPCIKRDPRRGKIERFGVYSPLQLVASRRMAASVGSDIGDGVAIDAARLRAARESAGMSLSQLAAKIGYSRSALGHFETGVRTPPSAVVLWYEQICGTFFDPVSAVTALGRADVDRRSFLRRAAYSTALSATALMQLPEAARLITAGSARRVGVGEVEAVHAVTTAFLQLDETRGGGIGRTAVAEFLATDVAALLSSRFSDANTRAQAFGAASELAYLAGFKAHDAGQDGIAQRYYLSALRLAEEAGNTGQDAWVFRALALQGVDIHQRRFSVDLAAEALRRARGRVGMDTEALFRIGVARCHAESGNKHEALAVLRDTDAALTPDRTDSPPRWVAMWCPNKATVIDQAAKTFNALRDHTEAIRHFQLGSTIWNPATHARVHALTCADAGLARWRSGDLGGAVEIWTPIIEVLQSVQSARTAKALNKIRKLAPEIVAGDTTDAR